MPNFTDEMPLRLAATDDRAKGVVALENYGYDAVVVIYEFSDGEEPHTHILCTERALAIIRELLPDAQLNPRDEGQEYDCLYLEGPGYPIAERLFDTLPEDESWTYFDLRVE